MPGNFLTLKNKECLDHKIGRRINLSTSLFINSLRVIFVKIALFTDLIVEEEIRAILCIKCNGLTNFPLSLAFF